MYYYNIVYWSIWNQWCTNAKWPYFDQIIAFDKEKTSPLSCQLRVDLEVTVCYRTESFRWTPISHEALLWLWWSEAQTRPLMWSWAQINAATLPRPHKRGNSAFSRLTWMPTFVLSIPAFAVLCGLCLLVKSIWYWSQNSSLWMPSSNLEQNHGVPARWCVCCWYTLQPHVPWHLC